MEIDETVLMQVCLDNTLTTEDAVKLYNAFEYVDSLDFGILYVARLADKDGKVDLELLEYVARAFGRSKIMLRLIVIDGIVESMKDFINWSFKFFYYQEATGDIVDESVYDIFTSKYIPYKFDLKKIGVKQIINVES